MLQESAPGAVASLHDAFRVELRGKAIACNLRLASSALPHLLKCSGKHWLFVHPIGETVAEYPTVWTGQSHPDGPGCSLQAI